MNATRRAETFAALGLLLAACAGSVRADPPAVKVAEAPAAISVAGRSPLKLAMYRRSRVVIPLNERVGDFQEGVFCSSKGPITMTQRFADGVMRLIGSTFHSELSKAGYPRPGQNESLFEEKPATPLAADFDVGAVIRSMQVNFCRKGSEGLGGVWVQMRWEVYSPAARRVMYEKIAEGSYQNSTPEPVTLDEIIRRALAVSARNVLADQRFVDLMTGAVEIPVAAAAPAYSIRRAHAPSGGAQQNATVLRGAVVTIEAGSRTGSGFFVSSEGHVLTNAHVVGESRIVKVRLTTGRELVGEVLKSDAQRDVALLKTEIAGVDPLAIRDGEPNVGEDVYALGSPLGQAFSATLTRGILSGQRTLNDRRFLQSDVAILPGSSGGPLLDSGGSVIGMTVAGIDQGRANLNLFIPIREALARLAIELKD